MAKECKVCRTENCWVHNPELVVGFARGLLRGTGYKVVKEDE